MNATPTDFSLPATDETAAVASGSSVDEPRCAHCDEAFPPRKHGGGKPQKFCGEQCRMAHYANAKRDGGKASRLNEESTPKVPEKAEVSGAVDVGRNKDEEKPKEHLLVPEQAEITCYWNEFGELVIWQAPRGYDYGSEIIVTREFAEEFANQLRNFVYKA